LIAKYIFKINIKAPFSGDIWKWHQDYIYWRKEDGMPKPRVVNAMCLLDDMNEFNGPLFVIPGSHKEEMIDTTTENIKAEAVSTNNSSGSSQWLSSFSANLKYSLNKKVVTDLVANMALLPSMLRQVRFYFLIVILSMLHLIIFLLLGELL
jgi:hypothetical protein